MGFRILREGTNEYQSKLNQLKEQQLQIEMQIWQYLTSSPNKIVKNDFLARFREVLKRNKLESIDTSTAHLMAEIKAHKASLSSIQGNMEIGRLVDLLDLKTH